MKLERPWSPVIFPVHPNQFIMEKVNREKMPTGQADSDFDAAPMSKAMAPPPFQLSAAAPVANESEESRDSAHGDGERSPESINLDEVKASDFGPPIGIDIESNGQGIDIEFHLSPILIRMNRLLRRRRRLKGRLENPNLNARRRNRILQRIDRLESRIRSMIGRVLNE